MLQPVPTSSATPDATGLLSLAFGDSLLGEFVVVTRGVELCALLLHDDSGSFESQLSERFPGESLVRSTGAAKPLVARIAEQLANPKGVHDLTLAPRGTAFQQDVWKSLRGISPGHTQSYSELASTMGLPKATRAVARACAANPIAVLIPCHRVIRTDGGLGGYRWGLQRKQQLLALEGAPGFVRDPVQ